MADRFSRRAKWISSLLLLSLVVAMGVYGWQWLLTPRPAPAIELSSIEGRPIAVRELRGQVVLLDFWATSCAICLREMPTLDALAREFAPAGLVVIGIAMPYDRPDRVLAYAKRARLSFPIALDPMGRAVTAFGPIPGTPTRILIGRDGMIAGKTVGSMNPARLRARLLAALER